MGIEYHWYDVLMVTVGLLLVLLGLAGAIIPGLPGPPVSFGGLLFMHFSVFWYFSNQALILYGIFAAWVTIVDYWLPLWGTKKMKGTRHGMFGAAIGLVIGIFFFPPLGVLIMPLLGAFVAEKVNGAPHSVAVKSAVGSFLGLLFGTVLKFLYSMAIIVHLGIKLF